MNTKYQDIYEKARGFIYRCARPLELALWKYHFEGGDREDVLTALAAFQNADGGFGHALEADSFNPNSAPIQTWNAAEILREIGFTDGSHPIIKGILRYLDSGADFSEEHNQWLNCVKSNNDYPHAVWWSYTGNVEMRYNPTAYLAGFILRFAERDSALYRKGELIARQAYEWFMSSGSCGDNHVAGCFINLYNYLSETGTELADMEAFAEKLKEEVNSVICRDEERWRTEYVCKPSAIIPDKESMFYAGNEEIVQRECAFIADTQLKDGSYAVPWLWYNDYKEYELAANWWKSRILIEKMMFLKNFG